MIWLSHFPAPKLKPSLLPALGGAMSATACAATPSTSAGRFASRVVAAPGDRPPGNQFGSV
jgi:hypothetical protein